MICYYGGGIKCCHCATDPCCNKTGTFVCAVMTEHDFNCIVNTVSSNHTDGEKCHTSVFEGSKAGQSPSLGFDVEFIAGNVSFPGKTFPGTLAYVTESAFGGGVKAVCLVGNVRQTIVKDGDPAIPCSFLGEICSPCVNRTVITGLAGNGDREGAKPGKVGCKCRPGTCLIACGAVTNFADYLTGGGEGCILGGGNLCLLRGKSVKGGKICQLCKVLNKATPKWRKQQTVCLTKKGFHAEVKSSVKVEKTKQSVCFQLTKIRLCCLTTSFEPAGSIPVAYNGKQYALAPANENTAGYCPGEPVFMCSPKVYGVMIAKVI